MDAYQLNPSEKGTMAYDIKQLQDALKDIMKWKFIGIFDLEAGVMKNISIPDTANEVWVLIGLKNATEQIYGGVSGVLPRYLNSKNILNFGAVYEGSGNHIGNNVYMFYEGNALKVRIAEILNNQHIAARVYYR